MLIDPLSSSLNLDPVLPGEEESEQIREIKETNENLSYLFVQLQMHVEKAKNGKIHSALSGVEKIQDNLKKINAFLDAADAHLSDKDAKSFSVAANQQTINELFELFPHDLLKKETLSREELEAVSRSGARKGEHLSRSIPLEMMQVQRLMEERHEMVKYCKEFLTAIIRHVEHVVHNQR